ncbi:uncharacterized protein LOC143198074 isoform X2 [Rhynchophorus ferrugineus]|uniref:uncharacterized protein LOC143198074 isoform X2 n=1 Tax=Rhynchophorus ferrugineus TaxID=354439 RepID=UPI003FCD7D56
MGDVFNKTNNENCSDTINMAPLSPILNSSSKAIRKIRMKKRTNPEYKLFPDDCNAVEESNKNNENEGNDEGNIIKRIELLEEKEKCNLLLARRIGINNKVETTIDKSINISLPNIEKSVVLKTSKSSSRNLFQTSKKDESFSDVKVLPDEHHIFNHSNSTNILNSTLGIIKQGLRTSNIKNMFHKENINDVKLNNFKGFNQEHEHEQNIEDKLKNDILMSDIPNNLEKVRKVKNIFQGEIFDDLKSSNFEGFKTANSIMKEFDINFDQHERSGFKDTRNNPENAQKVFQSENFEDLKFNNFEGLKRPKMIINHSDTNTTKKLKGLGTKSKCKNELSKISSTSEGVKVTRNVFQGENFDDLEMDNFEGFKTANTIIKHCSLNTEKYEESDIQGKLKNETLDVSDICKDIKNIRNIFQGENFDDLKVNNFEGFKTVNTIIKQSDRRPKKHTYSDINEKNKNRISEDAKEMKNIFQGENFNDIRANYFDGITPANAIIKPSNLGPEKLSESDIKDTSKNEIARISENSKRFRNIFEGENFDDLKVNFDGLKTANSIITQSDNSSSINEKNKNRISESPSISKNSKEIGNIFQGENFDDLKTNNFEGFKTANVTLNSNPKASITNKLHNENKDEGFTDFHTCNLEIYNSTNITGCNENVENISSSSRALSSDALKSEKVPIFKNIFVGENFDDLNLNGLGVQGFVPAAQQKFMQKRKSFVNPLIPCEYTDEFLGFSSTEQETTLSLAHCYHDLISVINNTYDNITVKTVIVPNNLESLCKTIQGNIHLLFSKSTNKSKRKYSESTENSVHKDSKLCQTPNSIIKRSKKLGCHFSPTIQINQLEYSKAQHLFHDILPTSTPVKPNSISTALSPITCNLTPILKYKSNHESGKTYNSSINVLGDNTLVNQSCNMSRFILNKPSNSSVTDWISNLLEEQRLLEDRLRINRERLNILESQRNMIHEINTVNRRFSAKVKTGILYNSKVKCQRISLRDFVDNKFPEVNVPTALNDINPQNSHLLHFSLEDNRLSHIKTDDGAVLVPNLENRIGVTEIEHSFQLMDGVDINLIPNGWIRNHFKWIVWKLASYERMFPNKFSGCLSIENIIQQLKYRYDLEIDRARRSVLRKIYEKDDIPQKTMVLCVSKIIKNNGNFELELTDGWYAIRTVIDKPLSKQILKKKIRLGVKLIISGAELVNCDGCFPLEAPEGAYLKIHFNSTRRALWWAKLGYQKDMRPFPISLSSISMEGGKIGCIHCYIFRVYPVVYMEKTNQGNVWRNKKAEEYYVQEFQTTKMKELEKISSKFEMDIERSNMANRVSRSSRDIRTIDNPEELYEICKNWESEDLQDLSPTQQSMLQHFMTQKMKLDQEKALKEIIKSRQNLAERSVRSLLKVKLLDISGKIEQPYDFHIWKPQEEHFQELKENEIISIFNITSSIKWGLSATQNTLFRRKIKRQSEIYNRFRRKITYISKLKEFASVLMQEFDTIGIPVKKSATRHHQELWLTDVNENLLLIKISDPPDIVLLLDKVEEGQPVLLCNLSLQEHFPEYTLALADKYSTCTKYPDSKQMRSELDTFEKLLKPKDIKSLLEQCKLRIGKICCHKMDEMDEMDCTQMTATDIVLLQCVDKLI